jgi:dTDP-4-amino-4,6-dideoxygalactose transaminase
MGAELIAFTRAVVTPEAQAAARRSLASGWLTTGPECVAFEQEFAAWVGAREAVAVSSCTAALELSLRALDLPAGARVLVPTITFCGVASAVLHAGLVPVLADVDPLTATMSPATASTAARAAGGVQALVVLHYAGSPAPVRELAEAAGVPMSRVVEDAAHAVGTRDDDGRVGSRSRAACFSFYATKNLPIGEGGMITTDDEELADRLRGARLHGMSRDAWRRYEPGASWRYDVVEAGLKANLPDVAAAVGRAQLRHVDAWQEQRTAVARDYLEQLADVAGLDLPEEPATGRHAWHLFVVRLNNRSLVGRDQLVELLAGEGVGTSVHFIPLHHMTYHRAAAETPVGLGGADRVFPELLSLPMYPSLTHDEVDRVCTLVRQSVSSSARRKVIA